MGSIESHDRAAVQIQRVVRGFLGRLEALRRANVVYEKIYDPRSHRYYYYNTRTFETSWKVMDVHYTPDPCSRVRTTC